MVQRAQIVEDPFKVFLTSVLLPTPESLSDKRPFRGRTVAVLATNAPESVSFVLSWWKKKIVKNANRLVIFATVSV